jgi:hypothetical protein
MELAVFSILFTLNDSVALIRINIFKKTKPITPNNKKVPGNF